MDGWRVVCTTIQWELQTPLQLHPETSWCKKEEKNHETHDYRIEDHIAFNTISCLLLHLQALEAREAALTQAEDSLFSATQLQRELSDTK
jgi:hypothetical protein